ncbi:succinate dehydrogenase assembly factor 2 [Amphibiibacter pelophylacis]|uniref:Succinate dehydrogenase assembly factor 2 n=1 Tax=Amphibiibacter pelophylacis TaxID=1799477 RepID=A0ACC6P2W1_9BURK
MDNATVVNRLRWRCRRGMLENDLLIARFFERYGDSLTEADARLMERLMAESDNDLLDLLLQRRPPEGDLATPEMGALLARLAASPQPTTQVKENP